jgi:hypothetical protein
MGMLLLGQAEQLSNRSSINMNSPNGGEYQFIDHFRGASQFGGVGTGSAWNVTGTALWHQSVDANGWPTYSGTKTSSLGGLYIPASSDFAGPYTFKGTGSGRIFLPQTGTWTLGAATNVTTVSANRWDVGDATNPNATWTCQLTYSGARQTWGVSVLINDPNGNGSYLRNVQFYRTSDAADLALGNVFRTAWKQSLVDLCPSVIRFMNWTGENGARNMRFENRTLPDHACWNGRYNWVAGPHYGETTGTNQYSLASVSGTTASMLHGEIAICRIGATAIRQGTFTGSGTDRTITAVTNANPGVVTSVAHGFNTGDVIIHKVAGGMTNLNMLPCTITVSDADTYSLGVDTTSFGAFAGPTPTGNTTNNGQTLTNLSSVTGINVGMSVTGTNIPANTIVTQIVNATQVQINKSMTGTGSGITFTFKVGVTGNQYISLQVGSGSDRTSFPVMFPNGVDYASHFGQGYITAGDYKTFYFDKTIYAKTDGSGNPVYGVWLFNENGVDCGHNGGAPLEVATKLINELNELSSRRIDMWVTIPHMGLLSSDVGWNSFITSADYSAASNFAVKTVDVILNGAGSWSGLNSNCKLYVEYSNETWNTASAWPQTPYNALKGYQRWGAANTSLSDYSSMTSMQSYLMCKDIQAAFPGNSRIKYVLSGQGTQGIGGSTLNGLRVSGTAPVLADPLTGGATPMSVHDFFAWAAYVYNDDSNATYSWDTATAAWIAAGSDPVAKEAAFALYILGIKTYGGNETIDRYYGTLMPAYASAMAALGKKTIMYEGGWDHATGSGQSGWSPPATYTATQYRNFLLECKASQTWANTLVAAFDLFNSNPNAFLPADYIEMGPLQVGDRWGHAYPDSYSGGVEGAGLDLAWTAMGTRNRALS